MGYVFNAKSQDVTIFDPTTRQVLATKPLGVAVHWLSNEQRYWDGRHIWTYDSRMTPFGPSPSTRERSALATLSTGGTVRPTA